MQDHHEGGDYPVKKFVFGKTPQASKMIWLNALTAIVATLGVLTGEEWIQEYPKVIAGMGTAIALANVWLRLLTSTPIKSPLD